MGEAVTVRPAGPADAGAIAAVRVRTWRVAYAGILPADALAELDEAADAARRRSRLEAGGSSWALVASTGDPPGVAGFAFAGPPRGGDVPPGAGEI